MQRSSHAAFSISTLTLCMAATLATPVRAQIPDGATVVASFANVVSSYGGLFVVDAYGLTTPIMGLPPQLTAANFVLRDPVTGHLVTGNQGANAQITLYELSIGPGLAATVVSSHALGTTGTGGGGVNQAAWLPSGEVLLATNGIVAGPTQGQTLWRLNLATSALTAVPSAPFTAWPWNAVSVARSGSAAYVAYFSGGQIVEIPLNGTGTPRQVATLPASPTATPWGATGLLWDCNGNLVVTATNTPLQSAMGAVCRLTPGATTPWPVAVTVYPGMPILQGGALDPATCDLLLVTGVIIPPAPGTATLFRLDPAGTVTPVSTGTAGGWGSPAGVDVVPNPELYGAGTPAANGLRLDWSYAPFPGGLPRMNSPSFRLVAQSSSGTPTVSIAVLSFARAPGPMTILGINVLVDFASAVPLALSFAPTPVFPLPIPAAPPLAGMQLFAQAAGCDASGCAGTRGLRFTIR